MMRTTRGCFGWAVTLGALLGGPWLGPLPQVASAQAAPADAFDDIDGGAPKAKPDDRAGAKSSTAAKSSTPPEPAKRSAAVSKAAKPVAPSKSVAPTTKVDAGVGSSKAAVTSAEAPAARSDETSLAARRFRAHNTLRGPIGGFHVVDAGSASRGSFRLQLGTDFFFAKSFLYNGDKNDYFGAVLSMSWTILDYLEVFASVAGQANSNSKGSPTLFQVLGDSYFGAKLFHAVLPWLNVGGDVSIALLNKIGGIGPSLKSTSAGLRANVTADLQNLRNKSVPLILRLNLQYWFDNSANLSKDSENARYAALSAPAPIGEETRHLLTRDERFALGINRNDFVYLGYGMEVPIRVGNAFYLDPIVEWNWGIPVNRQGYSCPYLTSEPNPGKPSSTVDGCLDQQGVKAFPMTVTAGLRVLPPVSGLAAFVGVDVGLTGTSTFVRELAPTAPYKVLLGVSYAYDARSQKPVPKPLPVVAPTPVSAPQPVVGRVAGVVVDQQTQQPVSAAVVRFPGRQVNGRDLTALLSDAEGVFRSYEFASGKLQIEVEHPDYQKGICSAEIPSEVKPAPVGAAPAGDSSAGAAKVGVNQNKTQSADQNKTQSADRRQDVVEVSLRCELTPLPQLGVLEGKIVDDQGTPVVGVMALLNGPAAQQLSTDAAGAFKVLQAVPGNYTVRVENDGYFAVVSQVVITPKATTQLQLVLVRRPKRPLVTIAKDSLRIRQSIRFGNNSAEILGESTALMSELAHTLLTHPEIRRVEVQGHTDDNGTEQRNLELSEQRAESVRRWLVDHGVESDRLGAKGYGESQPLVPNITAGNRKRNRRVQFVIVERAAPAS